MNQPIIAVAEPGYADYRTEREILADHTAEIRPIAADHDLIPALREMNPVGLLVRERKIGVGEMNACPDLKIIARYGVGVDNIDLNTARDREIYVCNVPDYGAEIEVSEHAVAIYLAVQRRVFSRDQNVRKGAWGSGQELPIPNRDNATLGLIGCGRIGLAAVHKFRALGFGRVLVFDPHINEETARAENLDLTDLETLCAEAQVISLHAPLTTETRHMLNDRLIRRMRRDAIVVNVSRGGLVDEAALAAALKEGRIFGAGVDVFESEPPARDNPLLSTPNTVLSDHAAWYSERSVGVLQRKAAEEVARVLSGAPPANWLNPW